MQEDDIRKLFREYSKKYYEFQGARAKTIWYEEASTTNTGTYWASSNNYQTFFVNPPSKEEPKLRQIEDEEEYKDLFE